MWKKILVAAAILAGGSVLGGFAANEFNYASAPCGGNPQYCPIGEDNNGRGGNASGDTADSRGSYRSSGYAPCGGSRYR